MLYEVITGVVTVGAWVCLTMGAVFGVLKAMGKLRVPKKEEMQGLDINEHGADAYHGFQHFSNM